MKTEPTTQQHLFASGVYAIVNKRNGKLYVGSSAKSVVERCWKHKTALRKGNHVNRYLQAAWDKYGEDAFNFLTLERCHPEQCVQREQVWMDAKRSADRRYGYNLSPTASSCLGVKHTPEQRAKNAERNRGRKASPETKAKMSAAGRGRKPSAETRAKLAASRRGKGGGYPCG